MIPENIDIDQIVNDIDRDSVYVDVNTADQHPSLEGDLRAITATAESGDFGSLGVVVLDETPVFTGSLRDIAQEVLNQSSVDTIAVRAPISGAVVSDIHSRASLESAQHDFLRTFDYQAGTESLVVDVTNSDVSDISWGSTSLIVGAVLLLVVVLAAFSFRRRVAERAL